jgi:hypothetical protein
MAHPYSEWCICDQCTSVALMFLPDCQPYERRYLTPEHLATLTPAPEATTTEALRAIEPRPFQDGQP